MIGSGSGLKILGKLLSQPRLKKEDQLAAYWVTVKSTPKEICEDIEKATGVVIDDRLEDLLAPLSEPQLDQLITFLSDPKPQVSWNR